MRHQNRIVREPHLLRLIHRHGIRRSGGLKPHGEEHHLLVRILCRDLDGVAGRIDDAHIATVGFDTEQIAD